MSKSLQSNAAPRQGAVSSRQQFDINPFAVFVVLSACHILAGIYAPIQDCDEVFNYWEPTHYLTHEHGLQTWEYAPRFAIRSWTYAGLHALVIGAMRTVLPTLSKPQLFYGLRIVLGLVCAGCETRFFTAISRTLNERLAILFCVIAATSPGMAHASVAYLPSSFAMYAAMLGASSFMDWRSGLHTAQGIFWFAMGACLGWPFAVALSIPFLLEELLLAWLSDQQGRTLFLGRLTDGIARSLLLLAVQVGIDAAFYRKLSVVPLNIILYNVFSSRGPDLYGTEPWHFYLRNLALNFHVWLLFALLAAPILLAQMAMENSWTKRARALVFLSPLYLWLAIFTLQPHKEERFMYPTYPFLMLNAAYTLHALIVALGHASSWPVVPRIPVMIRLTAILGFMVLALSLSALRILGTWSAFSAPLLVHDHLEPVNMPATICLGKEWYRFPSHYLLPHGYSAKFIRSEFHGLLPGEFASNNTTGLYAGTWLEPPGMNDENLEDPGKYVNIDSCDYLVDSHMPGQEATALEPAYLLDDEHWHRVRCASFLDAASTPVIPRLFWTPDRAILPAALRRIWGDYCLLKRSRKD